MRPTPKCFLSVLSLVLLCASLWTSPALAQTPNQNVNIVSGPVQVSKDPVTGTVTILGDPFLQRQNEPSLAVSTANPLHLMAGANDYRSVDIPFADQLPSKLIGDAWCGWFFSADGGQSWQSTLLPGYPQDNTPQGLQSPLKAFNVCSDPTVRPGPGGMFYYSGIAFNRTTGASVVYVARFLDRNNSEKGNLALNTAPIRYLDTVVVDTGTTGQFLDKTWNAVLLQQGIGKCSITVPGETAPVYVPSMTVYVVWSRFTGATSSKIMVTKSDTCGQPGTYVAPVKVSEGNSVNQGTVVAVNQATRDIYMAWRRFKTSSQSDAMLAATCDSTLKKCSKAVEITANLGDSSALAAAGFSPYKPFDQPSTPTTFRTNSMPAIAVSVKDDRSHTTRIHVAFAALNAQGDAKILLATSSDGLNWPAAQIQPVDSGPVDELGNLVLDNTGNSLSRGHQLMPAMAFSEGKLVIAYYFSNFDHTVGRYQPEPSFPDPDPDTGKFFNEYRDKRAELLANPSLVYSSLDDAAMSPHGRRHTIDVRLSQIDVNGAGNSASPYLAITHAVVSHYVFGASDSLTLPTNELEDLQANPPNLKMFGNGTLAFIGDYIDVAGLMFVQNGSWISNDAPSKSGAHYVVWADNRDVRPPKDGNYANYVPPGDGGPSLFDPTQIRPACTVGVNDGQVGIKDQNVYLSRITQGFLLTVPQNMKPLTKLDGTPIERAFTVLAQNFTKETRSFHLTIDSITDANGHASFDQKLALLALDVTISPNSGVARTIFVNSGVNDASVLVSATEITTDPNPFFSSVTLNPPGSVTALTQPDGSASNINNVEVYNPLVRSPLVRSPLVRSPLVRSPLVRSTSIADMDTSVAWNTTLEASGVADTFDATAASTSGAATITTISEATYVLTNEGNTTSTYTIKLVGNAPPGATYQLIVSQPTNSVTSQGCQLVTQEQNIVVTNITLTPQSFGADPNDLQNPNISVPGAITVSVPPGDTRLITLRGQGTLDIEQVTESTAPAAVTQGANTNQTTTNVGVPLFIITTNLPIGVVAAPYGGSGFALQTIGGTLPFNWSVESVQGNLSDLGLSFDGTTGTIFGTPTHAGSVTVKFTVTDSATPDQGLARKTLTLTVDPADTIVKITSDDPDPSGVGQPIEVYFTVNAASPSSGAAIGSVTVSVNDGSATPCTADVSTGHCTLIINLPGTKTLRADFLGNADYNPSFDTTSHGVKADTITTITSFTPEPSVVGQPVAVNFSVVPKPPATGTPTGTVTVTSDEGLTCSGTVAAGSCTLTFTSAGNKTVTASYAGDGVYSPSTTAAGTTHTVNKADTTAKITADTPDPSVTGQSYSVSFAVTVNSPGAGSPTGNVTVVDGTGGTCTASLAAGSCTLTSTTAGAKILTATYAGDSNFNASPASAGAAHTVNKADTTTTITAETPDPSVTGQSYSVSFAVSVNSPGAGSPTGNVTVVDGTGGTCTASLAVGNCTLTSTSAGAKILTATYAGDSNFNASPASAGTAHTVNKADTTATITAEAPDPTVTGQSYSVSFAVSVNSPGAGLPTGNITVSDGTGGSCAASLAAGSCVLTSATAGVKTLTAVYGGDANFNVSPASVGVAHTVNKANTTTKITADTPDPSIMGQSYTVSFAVTVNSPGAGLPTGSVTVSDGAGASCTALLAAGSCSLVSTAVGTRTLTATYSGDSNFNGSAGTASHQVFYIFTGFSSPMATAGTLTSPSLSPSQNYGSAIPLKFSLSDYNGIVISDLSAVTSITAIANNRCSGPPTGAITLLYSPTSGATGGSTFRFGSGQFIFNWDTSSVPSKGCYAVVVQPNDGSPAKATYVQLK